MKYDHMQLQALKAQGTKLYNIRIGLKFEGKWRYRVFAAAYENIIFGLVETFFVDLYYSKYRTYHEMNIFDYCEEITICRKERVKI